MYAVFDGHGGGEVAKYSRSHFERILNEVEEFKSGSDICEGMRKGFLRVDESLVGGGLEEVGKMRADNPPTKSPLMKILSDVTNKKKAAMQGAIAAADEPNEDDDDTNLDSIGCTANVIMVDYAAKKLFVANAGDSRSCMGRAGTCIPLSFDHKPEGEIEIARIHAAGSVITEGRVDGHLNLTRALGDLKFKKKAGLTAEQHAVTANPDVFTYDLTTQDDFIIMGCDGCWETLSNEEMVAYVYEKLNKTTDRSAEFLKGIVQSLLHELVSPNH